MQAVQANNAAQKAAEEAASKKALADEVAKAQAEKHALGLRQAGLGDHDLAVRRPEQLLKEGRIKDMLLSELRDELRRRGASPVGKRWEIEGRLKDLLETDGATETGGPTAGPEVARDATSPDAPSASLPPPPPLERRAEPSGGGTTVRKRISDAQLAMA